jgi:hypothetical protein
MRYFNSMLQRPFRVRGPIVRRLFAGSSVQDALSSSFLAQVVSDKLSVGEIEGYIRDLDVWLRLFWVQATEGDFGAPPDRLCFSSNIITIKTHGPSV